MVYLSLPLSDLDDMFSHSDSFLFITDKDGTVLYTFGASQNIPDWQSIPVDGQAVFSGKEGTYVLTSRMANHNDWQFIIATPETIYWASSTYVQRLLAFAIILAALMGLLMTVLLLRYNYRPVNNLMRLLNEHGNGRDEYEVILSAFRNIQAENQSYEKNSHLQQKKMREQYLLSRLKGKKYMLQDQDFNSYYAIETTGYTWCLIALI